MHICLGLMILTLFSVEGVKRGSHSRSHSGSRKNRGYSVGLGRSQSGGISEEAEDLPPNSRLRFGSHFNLNLINSRRSFQF